MKYHPVTAVKFGFYEESIKIHFLEHELQHYYKNSHMLHQNLSHKQQLKILPQQIQLLNLFHLNTLELEHRIQQELEENPLLEETASEDDLDIDKYNKEDVQDYKDWEEYGYDDIPDYKTEYENYFNNEKVPEKPMPETTDFRQMAKQQFNFM